jgi:MtN3 and saliva related transmembrane protein
MDYYLILGYIAGFLTTFSLIPQLLKVYKTKSAEDLSTSWLVMMVTGYCLWFAYGVGLQSYPLIVYNIVSIFLTLLLLSLKMGYKQSSSRKSKQI